MKKLAVFILALSILSQAEFQKNHASKIPIVVTYDTSYVSYCNADSAGLHVKIFRDSSYIPLTGAGTFRPHRTGGSLVGRGGYFYTPIDSELNCATCDFDFYSDSTKHIATRVSISTSTIRDTQTNIEANIKQNRDTLANVETNVLTRAPSSTALSSATWTTARAQALDSLDARISTRQKANAALDSITIARVQKLDSLNATIASRVAAATAVSSATWTTSRAQNLDSLDAKISSRMKPSDTAGLARSAQIKDTAGLARSAQFAGLATAASLSADSNLIKLVQVAVVACSSVVADPTWGVHAIRSAQGGQALQSSLASLVVMYAGLIKNDTVIMRLDTLIYDSLLTRAKDATVMHQTDSALVKHSTTITSVDTVLHRPANALSTSIWTNARAGKLDSLKYLDAKISSRQPKTIK